MVKPLKLSTLNSRLECTVNGVGASEGFQSLFSYSSDPAFPLFSLQLRVLGDRYEFEYGRTVCLRLGCICLFQFTLSLFS